MYEGYELAVKRNKPVTFKLKGVETTLHPDQQPVDDDMVKTRIKDVLKELRKISNVRICPGAEFQTKYMISLFFPAIQSSLRQLSTKFLDSLAYCWSCEKEILSTFEGESSRY